MAKNSHTTEKTRRRTALKSVCRDHYQSRQRRGDQMKVGERQQQGRIDGDRKGTRQREKCPACQTHYLKTFFSSEKNEENKTVWVKKGKYCPNELCTFCRKDKEESK